MKTWQMNIVRGAYVVVGIVATAPLLIVGILGKLFAMTGEMLMDAAQYGLDAIADGEEWLVVKMLGYRGDKK